MLPHTYKHNKRLIILNVLSVFFLLFAIVVGHHLNKNPDGGLALLVFVPLFWTVWGWTYFADFLQLANWICNKTQKNVRKEYILALAFIVLVFMIWRPDIRY